MFDGFLWLCGLVTPVIMLCAGRMMWKHPPQSINGLYGYRTARSMKNRDTWQFAHDHCGRLWWKTGWVMLALTVPALLGLQSCTGAAAVGVCVILGVQCVVLIASIFPTERALKRVFDDDGHRKADNPQQK